MQLDLGAPGLTWATRLCAGPWGGRHGPGSDSAECRHGIRAGEGLERCGAHTYYKCSCVYNTLASFIRVARPLVSRLDGCGS